MSKSAGARGALFLHCFINLFALGIEERLNLAGFKWVFRVGKMGVLGFA